MYHTHKNYVKKKKNSKKSATLETSHLHNQHLRSHVWFARDWSCLFLLHASQSDCCHHAAVTYEITQRDIKLYSVQVKHKSREKCFMTSMNETVKPNRRFSISDC